MKAPARVAAMLAAVGLNTGHGLEIIAIERDGTIRWPPLAGHAYTVESRDDPTASWEVVLPVDQWPVDAAEWVANGGAGWAAVPRRFYRVRAERTSHEAGDYLLVDLSGGPSASSYPVGYLHAAPAEGWTDEHRTTTLVLRRIPAGTFAMGSPPGELGREPWDPGSEEQRQVTLTRDFYIGVFQVTQKQWERVMGTWPAYFDDAAYRDPRPVERVSWNDIRGGEWPGSPSGSGQPAPDGFVQRLRDRTGLSAFDLPTEAQWEFACRAGTTTALNSGTNLTHEDDCPNVAELGRYSFNGGSDGRDNPGCTTSGGTAKAGSYRPNAWGLYDMHGNVWEWCLDWYETYHASTTDPVGAAEGSHRAIRGGSWLSDAGDCRSARRHSRNPSAQDANRGFRVSMPIP